MFLIIVANFGKFSNKRAKLETFENVEKLYNFTKIFTPSIFLFEMKRLFRFGTFYPGVKNNEKFRGKSKEFVRRDHP